ncbi:hypothetical protein [Halalkalibacter flavus]|uniref:hypothetical protein n=1 Tax=Halalkalibacter flavus TaxID=3090668 RepID=UPI002FCB7938
MSYIHENGWFLFVVSEGITWVLVFLFLLSRYWLRFDRLSQMWLVFIVGINIFQILLGGIDFYFTGEISFFQIVIVLFITYACTLGSSDFARLDQFIKRKFDRGRNTDHRTSEGHADVKKHITYRCSLFFYHTIAFCLIHIIWYMSDRSYFNHFQEYVYFITNSWFGVVDYNLLTSPAYFLLSYLWSMIYVFEAVVILTYAIVTILGKGQKPVS